MVRLWSVTRGGPKSVRMLWAFQHFPLLPGLLPCWLGCLRVLRSMTAPSMCSLDLIGFANAQGAHGVVVSHPLRMRKALGSNPSVSICFCGSKFSMLYC